MDNKKLYIEFDRKPNNISRKAAPKSVNKLATDITTKNKINFLTQYNALDMQLLI